MVPGRPGAGRRSTGPSRSRRLTSRLADSGRVEGRGQAHRATAPGEEHHDAPLLDGSVRGGRRSRPRSPRTRARARRWRSATRIARWCWPTMSSPTTSRAVSHLGGRSRRYDVVDRRCDPYPARVRASKPAPSAAAPCRAIGATPGMPDQTRRTAVRQRPARARARARCGACARAEWKAQPRLWATACTRCARTSRASGRAPPRVHRPLHAPPRRRGPRSVLRPGHRPGPAAAEEQDRRRDRPPTS